MIQLDHIVYTVPNIHQAISSMQNIFEVSPIIGGKHPSYYSINALADLGSQAYLELISYDDSMNQPTGLLGAFPILNSSYYGWCISTDDWDEVRECVKATDFIVSDIANGTRIKPNGEKVSWEFASLVKQSTQKKDFSIPFILRWKSVSDPSSPY